MQDNKSLKLNACRRNLASFPHGLGVLSLSSFYLLPCPFLRSPHLLSPPQTTLPFLSLRFRKEREKLTHHDRLEHPASKQQLEDVWKSDDDMKEEEFEPKTFFMMHGELVEW